MFRKCFENVSKMFRKYFRIRENNTQNIGLKPFSKHFQNIFKKRTSFVPQKFCSTLTTTHHTTHENLTYVCFAVAFLLLSKCSAYASQLHACCFPNAFQMHPNAFQMHSKCVPNASKCIHLRSKSVQMRSEKKSKYVPNACHKCSNGGVRDTTRMEWVGEVLAKLGC